MQQKGSYFRSVIFMSFAFQLHSFFKDEKIFPVSVLWISVYWLVCLLRKTVGLIIPFLAESYKFWGAKISSHCFNCKKTTLFSLIDPLEYLSLHLNERIEKISSGEHLWCMKVDSGRIQWMYVLLLLDDQTV